MDEDTRLKLRRGVSLMFNADLKDALIAQNDEVDRLNATIERVRALLPHGGMLFAPMSPADPQWVAGVDAANAWWDAAIKEALGDE